MNYHDLLDTLEIAAEACEPLRLTPAQVELTYQALCKLEDMEETAEAMKVLR